MLRRAGPARGRDLEHTLDVSFLTAVQGGEEHVRLLTPGSDETRTIKVKIPRGVESGARLRLRGRGQPGARGGPPGDLILTIIVGAHPCFRREGLDLMVDVPLTIAEAALGADSIVVQVLNTTG